jgi:hypothetical protein
LGEPHYRIHRVDKGLIKYQIVVKISKRGPVGGL